MRGVGVRGYVLFRTGVGGWGGVSGVDPPSPPKVKPKSRGGRVGGWADGYPVRILVDPYFPNLATTPPLTLSLSSVNISKHRVPAVGSGRRRGVGGCVP